MLPTAYWSLGVYVLQQCARIWQRRLLGEGSRVVHLVLNALAQLLLAHIVQRTLLAQILAVAPNRIVAAQILKLGRRPIGAVIVVAGVRRQAHAVGLDQGRAGAGARACDRRAGDSVAGQHIGATVFAAGDAMGGAPLGHAAVRLLLAHGHRDRIIVVLAREDPRKLLYRR